MSQSRDPRVEPMPGDVLRDDANWVFAIYDRTPGGVSFMSISCSTAVSQRLTVTLRKWQELAKNDEVLHVAD
jgi:hypothetical protein